MAFWSGLFGKRDSEREIETPPVQLSRLRWQVFSERYFGMKVLERDACAVRPLAPGLLEAIVEDLGAGERTLRWEYLRPFGKTDAELFALARSQASLANGAVESSMLDGIQVIACNDFYLGAFLLERYLVDLEFGAFVAPITWHHWAVHRIDRMTVVPHIQMMRFLAQSIDAQAKVADAERLGTDVYWLRDGKLERIDLDRDEPVLSRELARVLESL
jgi:hypothetical protein